MSNPWSGKLTPRKAREILGVDEDADKESIKEAFKAQLPTYHPDHGGSTDKFIRLKKAHELLLEQTESSGENAGQGVPNDRKGPDRTQKANRERRQQRQERRERQRRRQERRERRQKRREGEGRQRKRQERRDKGKRRSRDYPNRDQRHSGERADADEQPHSHQKNSSSQQRWLPQFLMTVYEALGIVPVLQDFLRLTGLDTAIDLTQTNGSLTYFPVAWGITIRRGFWPAVTAVLHTSRAMGIAFVRHPARSVMWGFTSMIPFFLFIYTLAWYTDAGLRLLWAVILGIILLAWLRILVIEIPELGYYSGMSMLCIWIWYVLSPSTDANYSLIAELNVTILLLAYAMVSFVYLQRHDSSTEA